jgi:uncharacterized membrane protein SirB2
MPAYSIWKTLHVACAVLSISGFLLRGYWMLVDSPWLRHRLTRVLPHINDTLLLTAAIVLAVQIHQYPLVNAWLTAKLIALVVYVVLGTIALKRGRSREVRVAAFIAAVAVFAYIVAVALAHNPLPYGLGL